MKCQCTNAFRKRYAIPLLVTLVSMLMLITPVAASNTVTQKIKPGARTASIADASLSEVGYSHTTQISSGTLTLAADDSSGSNQGWNVTVQTSDFVSADASGNTIDSIPGSNFSITSYGSVTRIAGQPVHSTKGPVAGTTGTLHQAIKVLSADQGHGKGTYTLPINVSLSIPGQTLAGDYKATLTVSIGAGP
ncbi:MAG: hypothetical protein C4345_06820 [Chloroflexota bacterium]